MDVSGAVNAAPLWGREIQVGLELKLSAREPFDDQRGAGAGRTTQQVGCFGAICAFHCAEQLAATCEGRFPVFGWRRDRSEETEVRMQPALWAEREEEIGAGTHPAETVTTFFLLLAARGIVSPRKETRSFSKATRRGREMATRWV